MATITGRTGDSQSIRAGRTLALVLVPVLVLVQSVDRDT